MPHCWKSHAAAQILVIRAGIHKMLVKIANREDLDQTASSVLQKQSDLGLPSLPRPFLQATSV